MADEKKPGEPTLDQRRAKHAWESLRSLGQAGKDKHVYGSEAQEYAREARKLPTRIIASGLGQALAFLLAKAKEKKKGIAQLHQHLSDWVIQKRPLTTAKRPKSLLESIIEGDADFLRLATDETLAYLSWLNRFAEAEIHIEDQERN